MQRFVAIVVSMVISTYSALATPVTTGVEGVEEDGAETAKLKPELTYRMAFLEQRKSSAYHNDEEHRDWVDQVYISLVMERSYDYRYDVLIEPVIRTIRNDPADIEPVIDQAYISMRFSDRWGMVVGKKVEYSGSGFILNPSDLIHENKDVFDALYQREGKYITKAIFNYSGGTLSLGFLPNRTRNFGEGKFLFQATSDIGNTDTVLSFTSQEEEKATTGLSVSKFFGARFELHLDSRYQSRQRTLKETNKDLREVPFNEIATEDGAGVYLVGTRVVLSPKRTILFEGIVNEPGLDSKQMRAFYESERFTDPEQTIRRRGKDVLDPDPRLIGRNYAFFSYRDEETLPATLLALNSLVNLDDQSIFATIQIQKTLSNITIVELTPTFFRGDYQSEFGELPFQSTVYVSFRGLF